MKSFKSHIEENSYKSSPIYKEYLQLRKLPIKSLRDILSRNYKVVDLKGYDKIGAISQILRDKYGNKRVDKVFSEAVFGEYKVPSNYAAMMAKKRKKAGTSEFGSKKKKTKKS